MAELLVDGTLFLLKLLGGSLNLVRVSVDTEVGVSSRDSGSEHANISMRTRI